MTTELTSGFHIFLAIAFTCFMWVCVVRPYTSLLSVKSLKYLPIIMILIIATVLTSVVLHEELYKKWLPDKSDFAIVKIVTLLIGVIGREIFLYHHSSSGSSNYTFFTYFVMFFFMINILEASVISYLDNKENTTNIIIFSNGLLLCVILCIMLFKGYKVGMKYDKTSLYIVTNFGPLFIMAYTIWNLLFVVQTGNVPILLNFCSTLLLPILVEYSGQGDWLQTRGISLLFFILFIVGFGNGESNVLPMYNTPPEETVNDNTKSFIMILSCVLVAFSFINEII